MTRYINEKKRKRIVWILSYQTDFPSLLIFTFLEATTAGPTTSSTLILLSSESSLAPSNKLKKKNVRRRREGDGGERRGAGEITWVREEGLLREWAA